VQRYILIHPWLNQFAIDVGLSSGIRYINSFNHSSDLADKAVAVLDDIRKDGVNVTVLIIPSKLLWLGYFQKEALGFHEYFVSSLAKNRFQVVDAKGLFESSGDPLQYHFMHDGHWNALGHKAVAQKLNSFITENGLLHLSPDGRK
jgi:hypothetical protein